MPLRGALLVLRQQMRRHVRRDLLWAGGLLLILLVLSGLLETPPDAISHEQHSASVPFWQETVFYLYSVHAFGLRWLLMFNFVPHSR